MIYNELYDKRLEKVRDCIEFKNKHVVSTYMGQGCPPAHTEGLTMAEYVAKPKEGFQHFLNFVNRINDIAEIDCINAGYGAYNWITLATIWWSRIKRPGVELPENSVWQVEEKKRMEVEDYDFILKNGVKAFTDRLYPEIIDMQDFPGFIDYMTNEKPKETQSYIEAGYPLLAAGFVCPPFETLCGGRGMSNFFMDCYKIPDKVQEVQDLLMEDIRKSIAAMPSNEKFFIGAWDGGWRGASNMVSQKIWDRLVWPYMKEVAELLIDKGITPVMHLDASWDRDIERFLELPAKKMILNTDNATDLRRARKILGDHAAFMGDVPVQMLAVSSKEEVKDYCRRLIDDIGIEGLFLCAGCDAPANAKFENLVAIYEVAKEY